ncbi:MAG: hypothetical protein JEZ11_23685 [Desulfobacterales bacterium]|nr:hypothetical protein [Desulfobacterales bacterium]
MIFRHLRGGANRPPRLEKYLWQGLTRLLAVYNGADNLILRFEYADGRMPFAMVKAGIRYYLTFDQVGSLRIVADTTGNVVKRIDYDAFGNILSDTNPAFEVSFGFAGGHHDRDTGLVRFGYRDYDPDTGRWTAKDPIFFDGGDADLYGYVLNDPINFIDPEGKWANIVIGAISGAIGGAASGLMNGNVVSAVIGGVSGAVIGGLVGTVNPFGSNAAGAIAGSWTAGVIGGFGGGAFSGFFRWATSPCTSAADVLGSANEGAIGSGMVGLFTSPFGYFAEVATGSSAVAAVATESIGMPLGLATSSFIPKGGVFIGR